MIPLAAKDIRTIGALSGFVAVALLRVACKGAVLTFVVVVTLRALGVDL